MLLYENRHTAMRHRMLKASATLEATLVIPLYVYAVLAVMFVIRLLNVYVDVDRAAYNTAREMCKYAYLYDKQDNLGILNGQLYTSFMSNIGTSTGRDYYVVGGTPGFFLTSSRVCDGDSRIQINAEYTVKNPFDIFGIGIITVRQGVIAEAWLGEEKSGEWDGKASGGINSGYENDSDPDDNSDSEDGEEGEKVYITPWGMVYHTTYECSLLDLSISLVSFDSLNERRNQSGGKYYPCESCCRHADTGTDDGVYITDYGDRYHSDRDCPGLKRTVKEVDIKEVSGMSACQKCGGNHN